MAYIYNIPQPNDALSVSQGQILGNFGALGAIAGNTQPSSNSLNTTSGFNWIFLPVQGAVGTPPILPPAAAAFGAGVIGLYTSLLNAGAYSTGRNELFIQKKNPTADGDIQIPATACNRVGATTGWTYLPSGIMLQWNIDSVVYGSNVKPFPVAFPAACFGVIVCISENTGVDNDVFVRATDFNQNNYTCFVSKRTTTTPAAIATGVQYIAIGI